MPLRGLHFEGAVFLTRPGINPTLTMWAPCHSAVERHVERRGRREG